jgi:hypothetical protein
MVTPLIFNNYTGSGIFFQSSYSFSLQSGTALGLDSWVVTLVSCLGCNQKACKELYTGNENWWFSYNLACNLSLHSTW